MLVSSFSRPRRSDKAPEAGPPAARPPAEAGTGSPSGKLVGGGGAETAK